MLGNAKNDGTLPVCFSAFSFRYEWLLKLPIADCGLASQADEYLRRKGISSLAQGQKYHGMALAKGRLEQGLLAQAKWTHIRTIASKIGIY